MLKMKESGLILWLHVDFGMMLGCSHRKCRESSAAMRGRTPDKRCVSRRPSVSLRPNYLSLRVQRSRSTQRDDDEPLVESARRGARVGRWSEPEDLQLCHPRREVQGGTHRRGQKSTCL